MDSQTLSKYMNRFKGMGFADDKTKVEYAKMVIGRNDIKSLDDLTDEERDKIFKRLMYLSIKAQLPRVIRTPEELEQLVDEIRKQYELEGGNE